MIFGAILMALTIDDFGKSGNTILHVIGFGCYVGAIFITNRKKKNK